jgi:RNA polymerase sigma-70 factor (ECF subfamily)
MTVEGAHDVADLVRRARDRRAAVRDQHAAFTVLVERFEDMAFATALSVCEDIEAAQDACQDGFLMAWRLLPRLREPAAFGVWLKRLIRTQCARGRRRRVATAEIPESACGAADVPDVARDPIEEASRQEVLQRIRSAVSRLPAREREAIARFYFLGDSLRGIARALRVSEGDAGKCLYRARLRLRRSLARSVAEAFLAGAPTPAFVRRVQAGVFDEFVGEYRFAKRPRQPVMLCREGDVLVSHAGGQRNVLASLRSDTLAATEFDGEARFQRGRDGRISHFIYYEFGRRLGVANKVGFHEIKRASGGR